VSTEISCVSFGGNIPPSCVKKILRIKHGDSRCKIAEAELHSFAKLHAQTDLGDPQYELCGLQQEKWPYCGLLKPGIKILEHNATGLTVSQFIIEL
jgi:hypothetical protein